MNLLQVLCVDGREIIEILEEVEGILSDLENYREKLLKLKKLEHLELLKTGKMASFAVIILNYLLGFCKSNCPCCGLKDVESFLDIPWHFPSEFAALCRKVFEPNVEDSVNVL